MLGLVRGNDVLAGPNSEPIGQQLLNAGCLYRRNNNPEQNYEKYFEKFNEHGWTNDFHNFTVIWTSSLVF